MISNKIFSNDSIELIVKDNKVFIKVFKGHFPITAFNDLLIDFPRVKVTNFIALKKTLEEGSHIYIEIGEYRPVVEVSVSNDQLKAFAFINLTEDEFKQFRKDELVDLILAFCKNKDIVYGLKLEGLENKITFLEKICIAEGTLPVTGEDAQVTLYEVKEVKPEVFSDGNVNHYEMNLINKVEKNDWLGERIEPTPGTPGKTVYGTDIPPVPGKQLKLTYDKKTIDAILNEDNTKTTLVASKAGAVIYEDGVISVCNYLEIDGNVSFHTGNIDFDGFVEISDTIEDNFSVKADNNIQVMGDLGLGGIDSIESREGSIYIRGGIAGKNKAKIICNGDLYTKFAADCTIICKGSVNIGYYAMNADIKAKEVILESYNSKIIGGNIEADIRVEAAEFGNRAEVPTTINVLGFNKIEYKKEYDDLNILIDKVKEKLLYLSQSLAVYSPNNLNQKEQRAYNDLERKHEILVQQIKLLEEKRRKYKSYLQSKGDGEVKANKCIYPNVSLNIKKHNKKFNNLYKAPVTYYVLHNQLNNA
ncbi:hypothetical protein EDC19_0011 [Natranaerovirga hydrolytica]|uniref:Flagellar Assembly Protein A N-terminal region domain-containing protein n=1 Tax=Natranaerovirga hydrolytica TaxID=680378 RepID=A0A4R1N8Y8_9FIRM|nr:FapA family protein [Natranaerovirga hydrolytica]TCL00031.1 hypothetical protein EDC19_0011 [Natranaerovirga hydrolytica]